MIYRLADAQTASRRRGEKTTIDGAVLYFWRRHRYGGKLREVWAPIEEWERADEKGRRASQKHVVRESVKGQFRGPPSSRLRVIERHLARGRSVADIAIRERMLVSQVQALVELSRTKA